ncbi:MAG: FAD:protein FMN transferase, partial [Solirubrobacteraceae bacterium]
MTTGVRSVSFPALGGTAIVAVVDPARLDCARIAVQRTVSALDRACSRFREDSELTALGAHPGAAVRVSGLLLDAVTAALRAARLTDGDVDPTIGQALIALGYDRDFAAVSARGAAGVRAALGAQGALDGQDSGSLGGPPGGGRPVRVASVPGWQAVQVDPVAGTIRVPRGVKLDLGATGKALGADRAALAPPHTAGCGVLVGLRGDTSIKSPAPPEGWRPHLT